MGKLEVSLLNPPMPPSSNWAQGPRVGGVVALARVGKLLATGEEHILGVGSYFPAWYSIEEEEKIVFTKAFSP